MKQSTIYITAEKYENRYRFSAWRNKPGWSEEFEIWLCPKDKGVLLLSTQGEDALTKDQVRWLLEQKPEEAIIEYAPRELSDSNPLEIVEDMPDYVEFCETCKYWKSLELKENQVGACHRFPYTGRGGRNTAASDFCGEWKARS
jgi:hypothetical protein